MKHLVHIKKMLAFPSKNVLRKILVFCLLVVAVFKRWSLIKLYKETKRHRELAMKLPGPSPSQSNQHWLLGHMGKSGILVQPGENPFDLESLSPRMVERFQALAKRYEKEGMARLFVANSRIPSTMITLLLLSNHEYV